MEVQTASFSEQILTYDKAVALLNVIGEERQEAAQRQIESLVTNGLQTIFGKVYTFHLVQSTWGNKRPEVDFVVRSTLNDGKIIDTPVMGARGGGMAAVVGALLRFVILLLDHKDKDTPLILDESFTHLSAKYRPLVAEFIKELCSKSGIQVVMVTHHEEFAECADRIYELEMVDGRTDAKELSAADV